jgi:LacI family transcriptional regulator
VEQLAYAEGYNVFLCNTEENKKRELAVLESLEEMRVDGLVLCSSRLDERELRNVVARHATAVLVNRRLEGEGARSVLVDDEMGGRLTTQHLIASGHRAIGFLSGPVASHSGQQRVGGYRQAMAAAGLEVKPGWLRPCPPVVGGGKETARELLAGHPELTALVCYNDLVAVGALQACATLGRQVPGDVAVVGHDDIPLAALVSPPLTTCRVSRYELGMRAVRLLLSEISGGGDEGEELMLRPELVVRASAPGEKSREER